MTPPACRESETAPAYNAAMPRILYQCKLLHGPYRPPRLHVGARAECHLRGTVVITSWTDAKISWPRCLPVASKGHPSLLLDDELARAVRTEAAAAVGYLPLGHERRCRHALAECPRRDPDEQPPNPSMDSLTA
jgi:hypothetical protein